VKTVFADTSYWIATLNPRDDLHQKAMQVSKAMNPFFTVTSEMVLAELLNDFAKRGEHFRNVAVSLAKKLASVPNCEVVPQTSMLFRDAVERYKLRPDKGWGLTDCASFLIMEEKGISEALTHDEHFVQAGFAALLRDES
jgi:predicted nucleic acid-binding protein